jgi:ABC-type Fe3+ transport system permease subunit
MDGPKTVTATWRADATVLYATIAAVIAVIAAATYLMVTRRKEGKVADTTAPAPAKVEEP